MTYTEAAALMTDSDFRGRVKVSCLKYANSIMGEATTVPAHNTRVRWATSCMQSPDITAANVQPPVVMDAQVQTDGADITDAALQVSVETVVNKMM
jgi:hypothetical protein